MSLSFREWLGCLIRLSDADGRGASTRGTGAAAGDGRAGPGSPPVGGGQRARRVDVDRALPVGHSSHDRADRAPRPGDGQGPMVGRPGLRGSARGSAPRRSRRVRRAAGDLLRRGPGAPDRRLGLPPRHGNGVGVPSRAPAPGAHRGAEPLPRPVGRGCLEQRPARHARERTHCVVLPRGSLGHPRRPVRPAAGSGWHHRDRLRRRRSGLGLRLRCRGAWSGRGWLACWCVAGSRRPLPRTPRPRRSPRPPRCGPGRRPRPSGRASPASCTTSSRTACPPWWCRPRPRRSCSTPTVSRPGPHCARCSSPGAKRWWRCGTFSACSARLTAPAVARSRRWTTWQSW